MSWLGELVGSCLVGSAESGPLEWACENVFLSEKETPRPGFYDLKETPWAGRVMEAAADAGVRQVVVRKSSRTGFTEACLNVARWMPGNSPGHFLYAINSMTKAKEVMEKRLEPHIREHWSHLMTGQEDDITRDRFRLLNMDLEVAGSGGAGPFMEGWFKIIVLDEYEEHSQEHEDSTADRARGRQVTVDNPTLYIISKPQLEDGPIDDEYKSGSQEKFHVACPHCRVKQELVWEFVRFDHCKDLVGGYDMERVLEEAYYECRHCSEKISEKDKRRMLLDYEWVPESDERREGNAKAEDGKVSLHISDLYSLHDSVRWGKLAQMWLNAYVVNPSLSKMKWFRTNHLGLSWEVRKARIRTGDLDKLVGGFVKKLEDGTMQVLGKEFKWCYLKGKYQADLPVRPELITLCADKQGSELKLTVFVWGAGWEAWPIEYVRVPHEDDLLDFVRDRKYQFEGKDYAIDWGMVDAHYKPKDVYRCCVKSDGRLFPSMGMAGSASFRGKQVKMREDFIEGAHLVIYDYFSHAVESDFYLGKVQRMSEPRLWLPSDMGDEWSSELKSSKLIVKNGKQLWSKDDDVPNDFGDTCKMQYVMREILMAQGVDF